MGRILERPYAVGNALQGAPEPATVDRGSSRRMAYHAVSTRAYQVDPSSLWPIPASSCSLSYRSPPVRGRAASCLAKISRARPIFARQRGKEPCKPTILC